MDLNTFMLVLFMSGVFVGVLIGGIASILMVRSDLARQAKRITVHPASVKLVTTFIAAVVIVSVLAPVLPTFAQTPIAIDIPTDVIFTEANNWIETFAPIAAIGIGISIAIAVLGYLGSVVVKAFRG
ncbi:MAG: hypothetical protein L6Q98_24630 [Anaerolineae bacterium]|nr:hypothetical protein [Anaerolineae bacterium]NUQ07164.1 hypothetical protein [Anaerolineae bacterium]